MGVKNGLSVGVTYTKRQNSSLQASKVLRMLAFVEVSELNVSACVEKEVVCHKKPSW